MFNEWQASDPQGILDLITCYPGGSESLRFFTRDQPVPNAPTAGALGAEATSILPLPAMGTASAPGAQGRPFAQTVVNFATFLWVDNAAWHRYSATANDGLQAVTATAVPQLVTWTMGDGGQVVCDGPGTPYYTGMESSSCAYTYTKSSAHQPQVGADVNDRPFIVTAVVTYQVSWTCTGACGGQDAGTVGAVTGPASQMPLVVGEIQTVNIPDASS